MSVEFNPYQPPVASLEDGPAAPVSVLILAERGTRFAARFLDGLFTGIPVLGLTAVTTFALRSTVGNGGPLGWQRQALFGAVYVLEFTAAFLVINGWLLVHRGQTVGKKICGIRIAKPDGSIPTLMESLVLRELIVISTAWLAAIFMPLAANLVHLTDVVFIFGGDQKCIHDHLAGTMVVKA